MGKLYNSSMRPSKLIPLFVLVALVAIAGLIVGNYYSYVFAKSVKGQIVKVERIMTPEIINNTGGAIPAAQLFSFAVAIKDDKGEIHTASTEDRQWAVAEPGQCAESKFYPYPPWQLDRSGTFHNARLMRLFDCSSGASK
ncbi:MAG: hypothetical protein ACXVBC_01320 [Bdellovibrionota bacterium]